MLTRVHSGPQGEAVKRRVDTSCQTLEKLQIFSTISPESHECMTDWEAPSLLDLGDDECVQHKRCSHSGMWAAAALGAGLRPPPLLALHPFFLTMLSSLDFHVSWHHAVMGNVRGIRL